MHTLHPTPHLVLKWQWLQAHEKAGGCEQQAASCQVLCARHALCCLQLRTAGIKSQQFKACSTAWSPKEANSNPDPKVTSNGTIQERAPEAAIQSQATAASGSKASTQQSQQISSRNKAYGDKHQKHAGQKQVASSSNRGTNSTFGLCGSDMLGC